MAFDYTKTAVGALALLTRFGQSVTLTKKTTGTYDPETGAVAVTESSQSTTGVVLDYGTKNIDGAMVKIGDKQLLISPLEITAPVINDAVTVSSVSYTITMIKELSPAGTPVLYECNIRP